MAKGKQEVLNDLTDMFYEVQPDEDYLEDDEGTAECVRYVKNILDDDSTPVEKKIKELVAFNSDWFPDGLPVSEQKKYRTLLDEAEKSKA